MTTRKLTNGLKRTALTALRLTMVVFFILSALSLQPVAVQAAAPAVETAAPPAAPVAPLAPALAWVAYNDTNITAGTAPGPNVTTYTIPNEGTATGLLRNYATGSNTSVTVTLTQNLTPQQDTNGVTPNSGTDAYNVFNGIVDLAGGIYYGSTGWYVDVTFTGLDPAKTYTFVTTANRHDLTYTDRWPKFTIRDITSATNESTNGATISTTTIANDTTAFWSYNTVNGYVARWTGINPGADGDFNVRAETNSTTINQAYGPSGFLLGEETTDPYIAVTNTLTAFSTAIGVPSVEQAYTLSGRYLTGDITITAPTGYQVSTTSGSGFSSSLVLPQTGGSVANTTIYVRMPATSMGTFTGNITHTSAGATSQDVAVSGTVDLCATTTLKVVDDTHLSATATTTNYGTSTTLEITNSTGTSRRTSLLRWNLSSIPSYATVDSANIILTVPTTTGYTSAYTFNLYDLLRPWVESTATWTIYSTGNNWATAGASGATDRNSTNLWGAGTTTFNSAGTKTVALNASGETVVQNWINGTLANNGLIIQNYAGTADNLVVYSSEDTAPSNRPQLSVTYCVPDPNPNITVTGTLNAFNAAVGQTSAEGTYTVSGLNLTDPIVITAPTDFQVSTTSGSGFGSTVSLAPTSGTVGNTTIYVRLVPTSTTTYSANITHTATGATTRNMAVSGSSVPAITTSVTSLPAFSAGLGVNSTQQTYNVSGINLTDAIVVTPPADFLISTTSGSGYAATPILLTPTTGVLTATPIYVVFNRATAGVSSGNITHTATLATTQNVAVTGTAYPPTINASSSMVAFSSMVNVPSAEQTYTVAGGYLTGNITITAPTGYQISITSGSGFSSSLVLTQAGGSVATTTIYVRMLSSASGTVAGNISHTSPGATTQNVAVTGTASLCGTATLIAVDDTFLNANAATTNYGTSTTLEIDTTTGTSRRTALLRWDLSSIPTNATVSSASLLLNVTNSSTYTYNLYDLLQPWVESTATWNVYSTGNNWAIAGATGVTDRNSTNLWGAGTTTFSTTGAKTVALNASGITVVQNWINGTLTNRGLIIQNYVAATSNNLIINSSEIGTAGLRPILTFAYCVPEPGPVITVTGSLSAFITPVGTPSASQSYSVSGVNLTEGILVTPPAGFEVSADNTTFTPTITLPAGGGTVYVRLTGAALGSFSGNIVHTSAGATTQNLAASGTVANYYTLTTAVSPLASGSITLSPTGGYYPSGTVVTVTAVANSGYVFANWSGDLSGSINPTTITMDANHSITANFYPLSCTDISLTAVADNWLRGSQATTNYGGDLILSMNPNGTNSQVSLLRWDLSSIPANATINSGSLTVYITDDGANLGPSTKLFSLYSLRRAWVEGTGTTDNTPSTTSSNYNTYDGVNSWGTAGAQNTSTDRYNTNLWTATTSTFNVSSNTSVTVPLNASGVSVLQGWYNTPASNFGLTVQNPATDSDYLVWASREAAVEAQRPRLNLNYCVPITGPTITVTGSLTAFQTPLGTPSAAQTYTVSGSSLTADILINPPGGFELSTNGTTYTPTLTLAQTGGIVNSTTVYVRLTGTDLGTFSGNIAHSSTGAVTQNLAASGTVANYYTLTTSITPMGAGSITLNPTGGYYPEGTVVTLTAVANSGFAFDYWAGDAGGTTNPTTVTMNGNRIVEAVFETAEVCTTVNLRAVEDTYMSANDTDANNGGNTEIHVDNTTGTARRGALLRWNLGSIPTNATVSTASITVNVTNVSPLQFNLYNMLRDWVEGTSVQAASTNSATWDTYNGVNTWESGGAAGTTLDRSTTNLWSATTSSYNTLGSRTEVLNASGVAVVQGWISGSLTNYGLTMQNYSGTTTNAVYFDSSEDTTEANRPTLNVTYCIPAPEYTLSITPDANGTVSVDPVQATYLHGTVVTLTPVANSGYVFASWGGANAEDPTDNGNGTWALVMDENKVLTAAFSLIPVNVAPNAPVLVTPADTATGVGIPPTLSVTASDPNAGDTSLTVNFYGRPAGGTAGPDFTVIAIPDSQNEAQYYPTVMYNQLDWIELGTADNIVFVTAMGDIVNTSSSATQYANADAAYDRLDLANVPYSVSPGNHDLGGLFNTYFGPSRWTGKTWYQGNYASDTMNNYSFFSASGNDFILINLTYSPSTAVTDWADALLKANPTRRGIIVQHNVLNTDNSWNSQTSFLALRDNPNFFLMLCGHMHTASDGSAYRAETGTDGHTIHVLMTDYQDFPNGGNGYLRLLRFSPADDKIYSTVYSPTIPGSRTSSTDYEQFEMVYDLNGSTAAAYTLIGTAVVANGANASISWTGLADTTQYEWYATVSDAALTTTGPTWSFTTGTTAVNHAPTDLTLSPASIAENQPSGTTVGALTSTDPDAGNTFTYTLVSGTGSDDNASFSISGSNLLTAAVFDFETKSSYSVRIRTTDQGGLYYEEAVTITVTNVNEAPIITEGATAAVTMSEDGAPTPFNLTLHATDVDAGTTLTWSISDAADHGTATASGTGLSVSVGYTPAGNYNGPDSFIVQVGDGILVDNITVNVTVEAVNDPPLITGQLPLSTPEDTDLTLYLADVTVTDVDNNYPTGFSLTVLPGTNYSVVSPTITPAANFNGTLTVSVQVNDGSANSNIYPLAVTVTAVNDPPSAVDDSTSTPQDTPLDIPAANLLVNDTDVDGPSLSVTGVNNPVNGTVGLVSGTITFTPAAGFIGTGGFDYTVTDGEFSDTGHVTVDVYGANVPPVITEGLTAAVTMSEDGSPTAFSLTLHATDFNPADTLTWSISSPASNGTATASGTGLSVVVGYTPAANYFGSDSFGVQVSDGHGGTDVITVNVTIEAVNDAPVITAQAMALSTPEETALAILPSHLTVTDPDDTYPADFTLAVQTGANYSLAGNTLTPALNFNGTLTVPVIVNDGSADSNTFNLSVTVSPVNDAPIITTQAALSTPEDTALAILLANLTVTDPDDTYPADFTLTVLPGTNYSVVSPTITPALDFNGTLTVPVYVNDGTADSNTFNLSVTVSPVNDAPVAADDNATASVDTPLDIPAAALLANDSDVDGPSLSVSAVSNPVNGAVSLVGTTITFTPAAGFSGTAGFDYTLTDGTLTDTGHVTVIVSAAPLIYTILLQPGWNLVSFNLVPVDPATTAVLASVAGQYNLVYAWNASLTSNNWLHYDPTQPVGNDLLTLSPLQGFWINITAVTPVTLTITGTSPVSSIIELFDDAPGAWNLVSFPASTPQPLPEALSLHDANDLGLLIFSYHAGESDVWKMYDRTAPAYANDLISLTPGWGYWIKVTGDWDWDVAY